MGKPYFEGDLRAERGYPPLEQEMPPDAMDNDSRYCTVKIMQWGFNHSSGSHKSAAIRDWQPLQRKHGWEAVLTYSKTVQHRTYSIIGSRSKLRNISGTYENAFVEQVIDETVAAMLHYTGPFLDPPYD